MDAFGFATKAKAKLVARGDTQRESVDFADLYAPCCDVECSFIGSYWSGRPPEGRMRCQQQERHALQAHVK